MIYSAQNSQGYRLSYQLIHWGIFTQDLIDLRNDVLPILGSLTENTEEFSILSMRFENITTWLESLENRRALRLVMHVGQILPLYAEAYSNYLLAFISGFEIEHIPGGVRLAPKKRNIITVLRKLRKELCLIRTCVYAAFFDETSKGVMGIVALVYNHSLQLISALGIIALITHVPELSIPEISEPVFQTN